MTVTITATAAATIDQVFLPAGSDAAFAVQAGTCSGALAAGQTCTFQVQFRPTTTGTHTNSVSIVYGPPPVTNPRAINLPLTLNATSGPPANVLESAAALLLPLSAAGVIGFIIMLH